MTTKPLIHRDHPLPVTRRQLLQHGLIGSAAVAMVPTFGSLLFGAARARAQGGDCGDAPSGAGNIPFLIFDLAGGAAMPGNFLAGKRGGPEDLLSSYDELGWNPRAAGALFNGFGLPMAATASMMLAGLRQTASADTLANLRFSSICHFGQDDTSSNQLSPVMLLARAGLRGTYLPKALGQVNSASGGNSNPILDDPTQRPLFVSKIEDLLGAVSFGRAFDGLTSAEVERMARGTLALSMSQIEGLPDSPQKRLIAELAGCGYRKNVEYTRGVTGLDPRGDATFQQLFGINAGTPATDPVAVAAAVVMNCLKGQSGPGILTIGGCDYHTGAQEDGDAKDLEVGRLIGQALEAARLLDTPLFFQILTDGGVGASGGSRDWSTDEGIKSMTVMGYYRPTTAPTLIKQQLGHYADGQGVDRSTFIGADASKVAYAVLANYLEVSGRHDEFEALVPTGLFTAEQRIELVNFAAG